MRYETLHIDRLDRDFLDFTNGEHSGNITLCSTDELVEITNAIRKEQGNLDLVGWEYGNEVYYNFYLMFNTNEKTVSIQALCNHGELDDYVYYQLPMTQEEERNLLFTLINILTTEIYYN